MICVAESFVITIMDNYESGGNAMPRAKKMDRLEYSHKNSYNMMTTQKRI